MMNPNLLKCIDFLPGAKVLDLGFQGIPIGAELNVPVGESCFYGSDIRQISLFDRKIQESNLTHWKSLFDVDLAAIEEDSIDAVIYFPPQREAKGRVFELINGSYGLMKQGAKLFLGGRRDRGILSYASRVKELFGTCELVAKEGRDRLYVAIRNTEFPGAAVVDTRIEFDVLDLPHGPYTFQSRPGVFSRDGLDPGTRLLIESSEISSAARVLDIGCGFGAIGIVAARMASAGQVKLVDTNLLAVECANINLGINSISNAQAEIANGYDQFTTEKFNVILSNPPFHEGRSTADIFIEGAASHLVPGGELRMVVMRPDPYVKGMNKNFKYVQKVCARDGYTVLRAIN